MEDNRLNRPAGKRVLGKLLGAQEVAIIPPDEEVLAHADGMVMWLDTNTLLVNDYTAANDKYHQSVLSELKEFFPSVKIVTTPMRYRPNPPGVWKGFNSACGVHVNSAVTFKNIYVPVFNMPHDNAALSIIRQNTAKNVFPINAEDVCPMGGGVRCLTWQLTGENAEKLILAARKD
ncbi:MAG: agmatine deiminase family protein [Candidatus Zeuxoniibacter abyssi]|nr:MAG: agmatine deiminase family protein [Candidatus Persebacteraceae bacterium AB1(2)]